MILEILPMVAILAGLTLYTVLGGADFGTGVWQLTSRRRSPVRTAVYRAIGPVWEANHVWLIFVITVMWTCYPQAFATIAATQVVPLFVAAVGIVLRGTAYALHSASRGPDDHREITPVFALSSLLTPFALGTVVGGVASGRVGVVDSTATWWNPTSVLVGVLAVLTGAFLAAVQLHADARRREDAPLVRAFRTRALLSGAAAGFVAIVAPFVVRADAPRLVDGLVSGPGRWAAVASAVAGAAALVLVWRNRPGWARIAGLAAVTALVVGWALAQAPFLLPGLTVASAAAPTPVLVAALAAILGGAVILAPSLALLFGLVARGRFTAVPRPEHQGERTIRTRYGTWARVAVGCGLAGMVLTVWAPATPLLVAGVLLLLSGCAAGFAAVGPTTVRF